MNSIFKKELSSFFYTLNGYVYTFFILLLSGIFFTVFNISGQNGSFENTVSMISYIFLLAVPMITMKSYAFERERTEGSCVSILPISPIKTAVAKYLALLTVYSIPLAIIALFPLFIHFNNGGDLIKAGCSVFGLFLFGAFLISIGMFISSVSPNQTVCAIISFAVLFVLYLQSTIQLVIPFHPTANLVILIIASLLLGIIIYCYCKRIQTAAAITSVIIAALLALYLISPDKYYAAVYNILTFTSVSSRFYTFSSGVFTIEGVVYYVLFSFLFVFLSSVLPHYKGLHPKDVLPEHKKQIKSKNKRVSAYYTVICLLTAALIIGVSLIFTVIPKTSVNFDITSSRYHSISEDGKKYISSIKSPVHIYHISTKENFDTDLSLWIDNLSSENSLITASHIDTDIHPNFCSTFTDSALSDNSIIITAEHGSTVIRNEDLYLYGITFMDSQIANQMTYDSAIQTYNAYIEAYRDDYGINISSYIAYFPSHFIREQLVLTAISECSLSPAFYNIEETEPISINPPAPEFSSIKQTVYSIVFSVVIPTFSLSVGIFVVNFRKRRCNTAVDE